MRALCTSLMVLKLRVCYWYICWVELYNLFFSAPDVFDRRTGMYPMASLTDYQDQTRTRNIIRNELINATRRVICYDQPIYNDERLELSEYAGLQLDVREATVELVLVQENYSNAAILILDDDSQSTTYIVNMSIYKWAGQPICEEHE